ncbi:MAG TPA: serine/threonine-protein kinase [Myxococcaceae bacterium]|nr:serine/threonine-protein kinase [Myxococcaceae bacterium]
MSHSASDIKIGTVLRDTYELTSLLGKGGMGSVFLARHLRLPGKQVAVKVLHHHGDELSDEQFARFRREAEIASQLGHPNIIEVLDFHTLESGAPYMVMEYLRGESLSHRLRKGRMSAREAFVITRQMGSALHAAHRAGVVHRDLKPPNVFLVPTEAEGMLSERVKLLDFGISKLLGSQTLQTQEDVLMGTPRYMSPEQAMGRNKEVDHRTDIFALGCIVYEMLCGDSPFAGGTIAEVVYRVVHENPESLAVRVPDLPGRAVAAVDRALAKNAKDRFQDVASFIAELTGTPLQTLSGLGPDPTPYPPRGAVPPSNPSLHDDESASEATFVPARKAEGAPPPGQGPVSEQSIEHGSTLSAFRAAEAAMGRKPEEAPVSVSRRPTDLEMPAVASGAQASQPVPAAAPLAPAAAAARPRSSPTIAVAVVALLALAGGLGWWLLRPGPTPVATTEPVAATPPVAPAPPKQETPPTPTPQPPAAVAAVEPAQPAPTTPAQPTAQPTAQPSARPGKTETLLPEARTLLDEAERALEAGDLAKAIRTAQRSQQLQKSQAAYLLLGQAYCKQKSLGDARAQLRNLTTQQGKNQLRKYCTQYDINL